jgi:hypothetical protein
LKPPGVFEQLGEKFFSLFAKKYRSIKDECKSDRIKKARKPVGNEDILKWFLGKQGCRASAWLRLPLLPFWLP